MLRVRTGHLTYEDLFAPTDALVLARPLRSVRIDAQHEASAISEPIDLSRGRAMRIAL